RAEKSKTRRHLTEFWMVEPEMAFAGLDEDMDLAEDFLAHVVQTVLANRRSELAALGRDTAPLERVGKPFPRITYAEALEIRAHGLPPSVLDWYVDLRRYGSVPHAGFGMGIERCVAWVCGLHHVRETIPFPRMLERMVP